MSKVLLIDIGGTNLRYAYSDGNYSSLNDTNKIQLSCIKGFDEILTNLTKDKDVDSLVISVAGPKINGSITMTNSCLLYTSPSPGDLSTSRMPSSA